jgi:hypothetical protein
LQSSRYDCLLFTFLFAFVDPIERCSLENFGGPWRTIGADLHTFEKETNKTFDDARWTLTIIQVALEYRDADGHAQLCRDTWLMRILTKMGKWYMKRVLGMEVN